MAVSFQSQDYDDDNGNGATGDKVNDVGNGATGNGATGYDDNDDNGGSTTGDKVDDYGKGATGDNDDNDDDDEGDGTDRWNNQIEATVAAGGNNSHWRSTVESNDNGNVDAPSGDVGHHDDTDAALRRR